MDEFQIIGDDASAFSSEVAAPSSNGGSDAYAALSQASEPASITKAREEYAERVKKIDSDSETKRKELLEQAKKDRDEWQANYKKTKEEKLAANRVSEENFIAIRDSHKPGTEWEKVGFLVDFNAKFNKNVRDTSRMKSILIQLKQTGLVR